MNPHQRRQKRDPKKKKKASRVLRFRVLTPPASLLFRIAGEVTGKRWQPRAFLAVAAKKEIERANLVLSCGSGTSNFLALPLWTILHGGAARPASWPRVPSRSSGGMPVWSFSVTQPNSLGFLP
jgi:hypothetical protein